MLIREYQPSDCKELTELFYYTVHTINAADYTNEQLNVWATGIINMEDWNRSFMEHYTLVAIQDGVISGFGDIDVSGYLDRLYVHKDYQRKGIATAICDKLEKSIKGGIVTHSSITAKGFFEKRGYRVIKKQQVVRQGIVLINFIMEKAQVY